MNKLHWAKSALGRPSIPLHDPMLALVTTDDSMACFARHGWDDEGPDYYSSAVLRKHGSENKIVVPLRPDHADYGQRLARALWDAESFYATLSAAELLADSFQRMDRGHGGRP